jgi:RNA polymerase sigma factor (sigma-70 family)
MTDRTRGVLDRLRVIFRPAEPAADADLLRLFLSARDEEAFAALVRRHGPMVLGVCRRVLGNHADAQDAFQATFLVLARRAAAVRPASALANWLHGVAYRTSLEARRAMAVRRDKEQRAAELSAAASQITGDCDLREVLDRELAALPEVYRSAVVLCDLEGLSRKEAAARLGWSEGAVAGRLARGRAALARRLARHGLAVSTAGVGLMSGSLVAGVPTELFQSTVRIGILTTARGVVCAAPAAVVALTEGVLKTMLLTKLKVVATALVVGCAVLACATAGWRANAAGPGDGPSGGQQPRKATRDPDKDRIAELERERDRLLKENAELKDRLAKLEAGAAGETWLNLNRRVYDGRAKNTPDLLQTYRGFDTSGSPPKGAVVDPLTHTAPKPKGPADTSGQPKLPTGESSGAGGKADAGGKRVARVFPVGDLAQDEKQAEALIRVVRKVAAPGTWEVDGGSGVVEYFSVGKALVVNHTPEAQKEIGELLELLRAAAKKKE